MKLLKSLTVAIALSVGGSMSATAGPVIWDYSPDGTGISAGGNNYTNVTTSQNFVERIEFGSDTSVTGMAIYMGNGFASIGNTVTIKLFSDSGAAPGTLLSSFTETISAVDSEGTTIRTNAQRVFAEFTNSLDLLAGSYYIGMSGTSNTLTQAGLSGGPDDGSMWQLNNNSVSFSPSIGDMAFRLYGDIGASNDPVPAPGALLLLGLGLMGLGLKRKAA